MSELGKTFLFAGLFFILIGLLLSIFEKLPFGLGRLPGDIVIKKEGLTVYLPLGTSILLSLILSLLLTFVFSLLRK